MNPEFTITLIEVFRTIDFLNRLHISGNVE
jgi:hypothetical protein